MEGSKTTNYYYQDGVVSYTTDGDNIQTSQNLIGTDGNIIATQRYAGDNTERSDIDIAVYGGDFDSFYWDIKEKVHSLLSFDVVEADKSISEELKQEIEKDGVIIYEKA